MSKILVIDDDKAILELVKVNLEMQGHNISTAIDALTGIALANQEQPDLIILDLMLPGVDGFTACQRLRQQDETKEIPILMLTALSRTDDKISGFNAGADDYLTKPFELPELYVRIRALLRRAGKTSKTQNKAPTFHHIKKYVLDLLKFQPFRIIKKIQKFRPKSKK